MVLGESLLCGATRGVNIGVSSSTFGHFSVCTRLLFRAGGGFGLATVARPSSVAIGRFTSYLSMFGCMSFGRNTGLVSINAKTNFPKLILLLTEPSLSMAFLSKANGGLTFVRDILSGINLGNGVLRDHTRRTKGSPLCHRGFSFTATETITSLPILYRCYVPFVGGKNSFVSVGSTFSSSRVSSTSTSLHVLNNGVRSSGIFSLIRGAEEEVLVVGGVSRAPSGCPHTSTGVSGGPLKW